MSFSKDTLINNLIEQNYLKTPLIIDVFRKIDRADFVLDEYKSEAYADAPLPIGQGQTISQPLTVAFILELLQSKPGDKILDIGFGSGWTTALLVEIVGEKGKVFGIERIPELYEFGKKNVAKYFSLNDYPSTSSGNKSAYVEMICGDGAKGYEKEALFNKILASASAKELPFAWKEQLKVGGRIVAPIGWSIWLFIKRGEDEFEEVEYPGFSFVPLISG